MPTGISPALPHDVETTIAMERTRSAAQRPMDYWCGAGPTDFVVDTVGRETSEVST
ncbi:uncharacterized protein LOC143353252 isoform X5 [Halictus rubicundus]|uniref:uncharacterized protein LOC143353252 isoform X5 n=1 Tax=Halictus rubicundus TaxID=77578 RepID=UPI0040362A10